MSSEVLNELLKSRRFISRIRDFGFVWYDLSMEKKSESVVKAARALLKTMGVVQRS
jgi:hypothetical protein